METIKSLITDSFNGFSPKFIPLFLIQLLVAGLLGLLFQFLLNKKFGEKIIRHGSLMAVSIALVVAISKNSLPFAVLAAAAIILIGLGKPRNLLENIGLFLIVILGIGCGVGSIVQTVIGAILIALVIIFIPLTENDEKS